MMNNHLFDDTFFENLAARTESAESTAPPRLKSRIYSRLMLAESAAGPLSSVSETKRNGRSVCVFEELVRIMPVKESLQQKNFCRVCHARVLAERLESAPIYWAHCPYVAFQKR